MRVDRVLQIVRQRKSFRVLSWDFIVFIGVDKLELLAYSLTSVYGTGENMICIA